MDTSTRKRSAKKMPSDKLNSNVNHFNKKDDAEDEDFVFKPKKKIIKGISAQKPSSKLLTRSSKDKDENKKLNIETTNEAEDNMSVYAPAGDAYWCPLCQVPFNILRISAELHTSSCDVSANLPGCPLGDQCENGNVFHYRDFSHAELAAHRASGKYSHPPKTPQKKRVRTPRSDRKSNKKRPLSSPAFDKHREEHEDYMSLETRKRLFIEEDNFNGHKSCDSTIASSSFRNMCNFPDAVKEEPLSWPSEVNVKTEEAEKAVDSSTIPLHTEVDLNIKTEDTLLSETHSMVDDSNKDIRRNHLTANLALNYDFTSNSSTHVVSTNKTECSERCGNASTSLDTMQAFCSFVITSRGVRAHTASVQSPVVLNLEMNNTGWETLSIKGTSSALVKDINISLCECSNLLDVSCTVQDTSCLSNEGLDEKATLSFKDLGLKDRESSIQQEDVEPTHQVSISTACRPSQQSSSLINSVIPIKVEEGQSTSPNYCVPFSDASRPATPTFFGVSKSGSPPSKNPSRPESPIPLEGSRPGMLIPFQRSSIGKPRPGTPTPFHASRTAQDTWTLHPVKGFQGPGGRKVPAYKRIPDTQFVVDAFNYGVIPGIKIYFLSHFHSDHYMGLRKGFNQPIFCSQVTANLVHLKLGVANEYLHVLKIGEPRVVLGVEVEIFDANHCPGAVMFLFRLVDGRTYLHVGDFRAHENMERHPQLKTVDKLYLDTTYCDPAYNFPSQEEVIKKVIQTVHHHLQQNPSTLFVCGSYTIGKEKVFKGIAETFGWKIWAGTEKVRVLRCLEDETLNSSLTKDPFQAQVHVLSMRDISIECLENHLRKHSPKYTRIVGFKPTGWTTSTSLKGKVSDFQRQTRGAVTIYGVPYSEHSSFSELRRFVRFVRPSDIQVTVNLNKTAQFKKIFEQWLTNSNDKTEQSSIMKFLSSKLA